jgi:hypothetical protein
MIHEMIWYWKLIIQDSLYMHLRQDHSRVTAWDILKYEGRREAKFHTMKFRHVQKKCMISGIHRP